MPAGHQGSVSKEKTGYQLPVADYQLPVADYLSSLKGPLGASPGEIVDFLSSFKGPHGVRPGIPRDQPYGMHENIRLIFRLFFHTPFFHILVAKHPPKAGPQIVKNRKNW